MKDKMLDGDFSFSMIGNVEKGREHLGTQMPVLVYRLFQYTMRAILVREYGKDEMIRLFRESGKLSGEEYAKNMLDLTLDPSHFIAQLQTSLKNLQIGILRFEDVEPNGRIVVTVGEDLDCSGLPVTGECVCNYDEGFLAGILSVYNQIPYSVIEVDCWAKGDRVCRFEAVPQNGEKK